MDPSQSCPPHFGVVRHCFMAMCTRVATIWGICCEFLPLGFSLHLWFHPKHEHKAHVIHTKTLRYTPKLFSAVRLLRPGPVHPVRTSVNRSTRTTRCHAGCRPRPERAFSKLGPASWASTRVWRWRCFLRTSDVGTIRVSGGFLAELLM